MLDSLQIVMQDSLFVELINLADKIDSLQGDKEMQVWLPLFSALFGGAIAIGVHWFAKYLENKSERKKEEAEIQSVIHSLFTQLHYQLKNLAYYKHDVGLQLLHEKLAEVKETKAKFYDEHYKSNERMLACESEIINIIANLSKSLTKLLINKGIEFDYEEKFGVFRAITFAQAKEYEMYNEVPSTAEIFEDMEALEKEYEEKIYDPIVLIAKYNSK